MGNPPSEDTKVCPFCAETIKRAAVVCRYCGRELAPVPHAARRVATPGFTLSPDKPKKYSNNTGCIIVSVVVTVVFLAVVVNIATPDGAPRSSSQSAPTARAFQTTTPTPTIAELKTSAITVTYDSLARETEVHVGKVIHLQGDVVQVMESSWDDETDLRVRVVDGDVIYVNYKGARVLVDDTIDLYAQVDGRMSYETVLGAQVTIPEVTAIELVVIKK